MQRKIKENYSAKILRPNIEKVIKTIDVENGIIDPMFAKGHLTDAEYEYIKTMPSRIEKSRQFVKLLMRKNDDAFEEFKKCIKDKNRDAYNLLLENPKNEKENLEDSITKSIVTDDIGSFPPSTPDVGREISIAVKITPNLENVEDLRNIGNLTFKSGDIEKAISYYEKAIELRKELFGEKQSIKDNVELREKISVCYFAQKKYRRSLEEDLQILDDKNEIYGANISNENTEKTLYKIGVTYGRLKEYENSIKSYEKCLKIERKLYGKNAKNEKIEKTLRRLGWTYFQLSDHQKAIDFYEEYIEVRNSIPDRNECKEDIESHSQLSKSYEMLENYPKAKENLKKAIEIRSRLTTVT